MRTRWIVPALLLLACGGGKAMRAQTVGEFLKTTPAEQDAAIGRVAGNMVTFMKSRSASCDPGGWNAATHTFIEEKPRHLSDDDIDLCLLLAMYTPKDREIPIGYGVVKERAAQADIALQIGTVVQQAVVEQSSSLFRNAANSGWLRSDPKYASFYIDYFRTLLEPRIKLDALPAGTFLKLNGDQQTAIVEHAMENLQRHRAGENVPIENVPEGSRRLVEYAQVFFLLQNSKGAKPFGYNLVLRQAETHPAETMSVVLNRTLNELDGEYGRFLAGAGDEQGRLMALRVAADCTLCGGGGADEDDPSIRLFTAEKVGEILPAFAGVFPAAEQRLFRNVATVLLASEHGRLGRSMADHVEIHRAATEAHSPLVTQLVRSVLEGFGELRTEKTLLSLDDALQEARMQASAEAQIAATRQADDRLVLQMVVHGSGDGYARLKGRAEKDGTLESRVDLVGSDFCELRPAAGHMTFRCDVYSGPDRAQAAARMEELEAAVCELFPTWTSLVRVGQTDKLEDAYFHKGPAGQSQVSGIEPAKGGGYDFFFALTL